MDGQWLGPCAVITKLIVTIGALLCALLCVFLAKAVHQYINVPIITYAAIALVALYSVIMGHIVVQVWTTDLEDE